MKNRKINILLLLLLCVAFLSGCSNEIIFDIGTEFIEKTMYVGDSIYLSTNVTENENGDTVVWSSSDVTKATVSESGAVKALAPGEVTIRAVLGDGESLVIINIVERKEQKIYDINLTGKQTVLVNQKIQLNVIVNPSTTSTILWTSSDEKVATVDQTGTITGIMPGVVTIRATLSEYTNNYEEIIVLVRNGEGIQDIINNYINNNIYITEGEYDLTSLNETVVNMVKNVEDSVIGVTVSINSNNTIGAAYGTGGIYKKEKTSNGFRYTVFTNEHVISDADKGKLQVYLGDIDEYVDATIIKKDDELDLAILTFEHTKDYEPLKLGEIGCIEKGDFVVAIGNPNGFTYYGSVTFGIISDPVRKMKDSDVIYVQHDTPINPGNSGGPLFNLKGEVIGINTLKIVSSDTEGMGFSIAMEEFLEYLNK